MGNTVGNTQQNSFVVLLIRSLQQRRPLTSRAMPVLPDTLSLSAMTGYTAADSLPLLPKSRVPRFIFIYWQSQCKQFREWLHPMQITLLQQTRLRYHRSYQYRHHGKSP
ncbi:MAG: hypothetical protein P1V19_07355 [Gimesia sp.]|nr:hypothetical protein [Gimesia sp.]